MFQKRRTIPTRTVDRAAVFENVHEWVLSLPWVVERPSSGVMAAVRCFTVDCEPLNRKRLWMISGLRGRAEHTADDVAVVLPLDAALAAESAGLGRRMLPMPGGHVLVTPCADAPNGLPDVEALVLCAYSHAMS